MQGWMPGMQPCHAPILGDIGCNFSPYNWKLPAYSGAFVPTVDNFSFFTYSWSFDAYSFSSFTYNWSFSLTMGKCV